MRQPKKRKPINHGFYDLHNEALRQFFESDIGKAYEAKVARKNERIKYLKAQKNFWKKRATELEKRLDAELKRTKIVLVREPGGEWKPKRVLTPSA